MKFAAFTYSSQNLGDDVQALAAALFSQRLDSLAQRDSLADAPIDEPHACVFNSWFLSGRDFRAPTPLIDPILHSLCIGRDHLMNTPWKGYLAEHGPVGARDLVTMELLQSHGIDSYWTGCLTTFMGERVKPVPQRSGVLLVDVDLETENAFIPREIRARAERMTNFIPPSVVDDPLRRLASCMDLMRRLASAEMVVTRRLHVALPCVGLGTPVCVLPDPAIANARRRFAGYDWLPIRFKDEDPGGLDFDWSAPHCVQAPLAMRAAHDDFLRSMERRELLNLSKVELDAPLPVSLALKGDFPARAGRLFLNFGQQSRELIVRAWSSVQIVAEIPPLPLADRLVAELAVWDCEDRPIASVSLQETLKSTSHA